MRVVLVGPPAARARLKAALAGTGVGVAAEVSTLADARVRAPGADGWLMTPDATPSLARPDDLAAPVEPLTAREHDVLELLAEGLSNKAIAARLAISDQTVKFHVASIGGKLGTSNRTETVRTALRRALITI